MTQQTSGSDSKAMKWPNGAKCAVCFTFDFDAESLWLAREEKNSRLLATLSQGRYGAKVGVPKILELLAQENLKGTFFTPGWTIDNHPSKVEMILKGGRYPTGLMPKRRRIASKPRSSSSSTCGSLSGSGQW